MIFASIFLLLDEVCFMYTDTMNDRLLAQVNFANPAVNPTAKFGDVSVLINLILPILTASAGLFAFAYMLYGAYTWITASGDPKKLEDARKTITYAVFGVLFVVISFVLVRVVMFVMGTDANEFNFFQ